MIPLAALRLMPFVAELSAIERWRNRNWPIHRMDLTWMQWMLIFTAVLLIGMLVLLLLRRHNDELEFCSEFMDQSRRQGLSEEETQLLALLTKLSGLKDPAAIFTMEAAFERGMAAFLISDGAREMTAQGRTCMNTMLLSVRQKLGFDQKYESEVFSSSRQIIEGASVTIADHTNPDGFGAVVTQASPMELVVEFHQPRTAKAGEHWQVRYCDGRSIWEFDTTVLRQEGNQIALTHSDSVRFLNRRRFPRVALKKPALLAPFPFMRTDGKQELPQFSESLLIEIAGPGLKLLSPTAVEKGSLVLVVLHLHESKTIQGMGKVYRSAQGDDGLWTLVVSLMSLDARSVAELAHETSVAEKEGKQLQDLPPHRPAVKSEEVHV